MVQNIHIQINRSRFYLISKVSNPVSLKVTEYEPYDKLSQKFNKYTHVIQYKSGQEYNPKDYVLCLDDPNAWYYTYILYLYEPSKKIISVDIYFLSNDKDRKNPLIFGFNYESDPSVYYTYYYVRGVKYFTGTIGSRGSFGKDDLISRLIDERGLYKSDSYHKFVIRLNDKPNDTTPIQYPKGGNNSGMITLKRSDVQDQENYVQFEHVISSLSNVESFYVSFHQDTLYMIGGSSFGKLQSVLVYYNKYNGEYPVLVVFRFPSRVKLYRFSVLLSDLSNTTKNISQLDNFSTTDLKQTLIEEYKRVFKEIKFKSGRQEFKNISVISDKYSMNNKDIFRRAILKPNTDIYNQGSSRGPYEVYNTNLFKKYTKKDFTDNPFASLYEKNFSTIYVYYTEKNEPLLIGFIGESDNKFFKISKGGQSWEKDHDNIKTYNIGHLYSKLLELEKERNERVSHVPLQPRRPTTHISPPSKRPAPAKPKAPPSRFAPPRSTSPPPEKHKAKSIKLDISITSSTTYDNGNIKVSDKTIFDECNLFCYFTHTHTKQSEFTISSLSYASSSIPFRLIQNVSNVKSVLVYFNVNDLEKPVILEFFENSGQKQYFALVISHTISYSLSPLSEINESTLVDNLIKESDRINYRYTFQIDQTATYNDIIVTTKKESGKGYFVLTHTSTYSKIKTSNVLYNNQFLIGLSNSKHVTIHEIQNKSYQEIVVYSLSEAIIFPVVIKLKDDRSQTTTYIRKNDEIGVYWDKNDFNEPDGSNTKDKLEKIYYLSSKSILIEIDKRIHSQDSHVYDMKLIDNRSKKDSLIPDVTGYASSKNIMPLKNIFILSQNIRCSTNFNHLFKCYSHVVSESSSSSDISEIYGLRLYISKFSSTDGNMEEIELYKDKSDDVKNRIFLPYLPDSDFGNSKNSVFVYFYHHDPRPLLISYKEYVFKRINDNNDFKWYHDTTIKSTDNCKLLSTLDTIHGSMKKKLIFVKGGEIANIYVSRELTFGSFRKHSYTPYNLSSDKHYFKLSKHDLIGQTDSNTVIDNLLDKLENKPFDNVNVYMTQSGQSLKEILLIEFINETNIIHFKRKDVEAHFWVQDLVQYNSQEDLQKKLQNIQETLGDTAVIELDRTSLERSNMKSSRQILESGSEFTKYICTPSGGIKKSSLIFYKKDKLLKKVSNQYQPLTEIENQEFSSLTVYFGAKKTIGNADCPLILEFKSTKSNTFYSHKRDYKKHYWERVNIPDYTGDRDLINKLTETQFDLVDSIVLLMDKFTDAYGDEEVKRALENLESTTEVHIPPLDEKNIKLNRSGQHKSCVTNYGFKMTEHFIGSIKNKDNCGLRFFITSSTNYDKYNDLILYDPSGRVQEYLYYDSRYTDVHFFYYGDDPRPLLLCYGGRVYRPTTFENYFVKWYRSDKITTCDCQRGRENLHLVKALSEVVGMLNVVRLNRKPVVVNEYENAKHKGSKTLEYEVQTYAGNQIKVKVSYENGFCYRLYRHEPIGNSDSDTNFRLGNLIYEGVSNVSLDYDYRKQLMVVTVFYNLFDVGHQYPLLVSLGYSDGRYDYYELVNYPHFRWKFIDVSVNDSDVESKAYEILEKLNINFERKKEDRTLFKRDECSEGSGNTTVIAAASGGGVTTAALVGGGITYAARPEWVITSIKALL